MTSKDLSKFKAPSRDDVQQVLLKLGNLQHRQVFFGALKNPLWVKPLDVLRAFSRVPERIVEPDGTVRADPWPEGSYLAQMASFVPADVLPILLRSVASDVPWVRKSVLDAALRMPPSDAAKLAPGIALWAESGSPDWLDARELIKLIEMLSSAGKKNQVARLANAFYKPKSRNEGGVWRHEVFAGLREFWYTDTLPRVAKALGPEALRVLIIWLQTHERLAWPIEPVRIEEITSGWRPSIEEHEQNDREAIGDSLVTVLRDVARERLAVDPDEAIGMLEKRGYALLRRIGFAILADEAIYANASPEVQQKIRSLAVVRLLDSKLMNTYDLRNEYAGLARAFLPKLTEQDKQEFLENLNGFPDLSEDEIRERLGGRGAEGTAEEVAEYKRRAKGEFLGDIGLQYLWGEVHDFLSAFEEEFGKKEHPGFSRWHSGGFIVEQPALDLDAARAMSDAELITFLLDWKAPPSRSFEGPSREGNATLLVGLVAEDPDRFAGKADDLCHLPPIYLRAILQGWTGLIEKDRALPWADVLALCSWIAQRDDGETFELEGTFELDRTWRNTKFQAKALIGAIFNSDVNRPNDGSLQAMVDAAIVFADHSDPEQEGDPDNKDSMMNDPLTLSLNTVRPGAVRVLISALGRADELSLDSSAIKLALEERLAADTAKSVWAVYGERFAALYLADETWLRATASVIFGDHNGGSELQEVALSTAIAANRFHVKLFDILRDAFVGAVATLGRDRTLGWSSQRGYDQMVGDWIVGAVIQGHIELDDPLASAFFEKSSPQLRSDVMGHLGWSLMQNKDVPQAILERSKGLWDARREVVAELDDSAAAELEQFYWWVMAEQIEADWWLPRLLEAVTSAQSFEARGFLGEHLAAGSSVDPKVAFEILERLLADYKGGPEAYRSYDLVERAAPEVLARALDLADDTSDADLRTRARALLDQLGRAGEIGLGESVQSRRKD